MASIKVHIARIINDDEGYFEKERNYNTTPEAVQVFSNVVTDFYRYCTMSTNDRWNRFVVEVIYTDDTLLDNKHAYFSGCCSEADARLIAEVIEESL